MAIAVRALHPARPAIFKVGTRGVVRQRERHRISFELAIEDERCLIYADRIDSKTEEQRRHAIGAAQIETRRGA